MIGMLKPAQLISIIKFLLAAVLATPLIAWGSNFTLDYTLVRSLIFFLLIEAAFLCYALLLYKDKTYFPSRSPIFLLIAAFFLLNAVSLFLSYDVSRSFWGTWNRSMDSGFLAQLHYFLFFVVLVGVFKTQKDWQLPLKIILAISFFIALGATYQIFDFSDLFGDIGFRVQSTLANPIILATYLGIAILFSLHVRLKKDLAVAAYGRFWHYLASGVIFFSFIAIFVSGSRGPFLGAIATLIFVGSRLLITGNKKIRLAVLGIFILLAAVVGFFHIAPVGGFADPIERIVSAFRGDSSVQNRFNTWKVAVVGISQKPFFGWGQEGFSYLFDRNYDPFFLTSSEAEAWWDRAHNTFLDHAAVNGIMGSTFFAALIVAGFFLAIRRDIFLAGTFLFYAVAGLTFFDALATYLMLFFALALVHTLSAEGRRVEFNAPKHWSGGKAIILAPLITALSFFTFNTYLFFNIARANYYMNRVGTLQYSDAIPSFHKALSFFISPSNKHQIRYEFARYVTDAFALGVIPEERIEEDFAAAKKEIEAAQGHHPRDARINWLAAKANNNYFAAVKRAALLDDGEKYAKTGLEYSPQRQQLLYELAQTATYRGDHEEAIRILKEIAALTPNFPGVHFTLGLGLLNAGEDEKGFVQIELALSQGYEYRENDAQNWLYAAAVYYKYQRYDRMIEIYERLIRLFPKNEKYYRFLAETYREAGRYEDAEIAARKILDINSGAEEDVKNFIEMLMPTAASQ